MAPSPAIPESSPAPARRLPIWKKAGLGLTVLAIFLALLEGVLALCGFTPDAADRDPFVGFSATSPHFIPVADPLGHRFIETAPARLKHFNIQRFPADKPANAFRIISLGGSTTYGRPFFDDSSFSGWLRSILAAASSSTVYEVINAGGISYGSYRVANVMSELCVYSPDLFIIYVGHNEFLERRTYSDILNVPPILRDLAAALRRTHIGAAADQLVARLKPASGAQNVLADDVEGIPINVVGPSAYHRDDANAAGVLAHFQFTLNRFVDMAESVSARIVFVVPASNLRDFAPFKSESDPRISPENLARWKDAYARGVTAMRLGNYDEALELLRNAESLDPRHADTLFQLARTLTKKGLYAEALARYVAARDEDICPLRASSKIQQIVRTVAAERSVPLVDFDNLLRESSPHGLPGADFFVDHVHPNLKANRLLAIEIARVLTEESIVALPVDWRTSVLPRAEQSVNAAIDPRRHAGELRTLSRMLDWLGRPDQAIARAMEAIDLDPSSAETLAWLGELQCRRGDAYTAADSLRRAVAINPDSDVFHCQLAAALSLAGRDDDAKVHLAKSLALNPTNADAHAALGMLLARRDDPDAATVHLEKALALRPADPLFHEQFALLLESRGRLDEALSHFREAVRINPGQLGARRGLARIHEIKGEFGDAIRELERVHELDPFAEDVSEKLGVLKELRGGHSD